MHFCRKSFLIYLILVLVLVLVLALVLIGTEAASKRNRTARYRKCHLRKVEKCLNKMTDLGKDKDPTAIITTSEGIDRLCKTIRNETLKCVKRYFKKCGSPIDREVSDLVMDTITIRVNHFCNDENQRSAVVDKIETNQTSVDSVHMSLCCGFNTWNSCTMKVMKDKCGKNGQKVFRSFLDNTIGRVTDMMCPLDVFPVQSNACKKIHPKPGEEVSLKFGSNIITKYVLIFVSFLFVTE